MNFQQFSLMGDVESLTPPAKCAEAFITVSGGMIRYRYDGGEPTKTLGHIGDSSRPIVIKGISSIQQFKVVRLTDDSTTIAVTYE